VKKDFWEKQWGKNEVWAMKVLVVGKGGREHAIVWKIAQSPLVEKIYCAPGNAGIAQQAECVDIEVEDFSKLIEFAKKQAIDLTVVGPEDPLAKGIVDEFEKNGLKAFGPNKTAAEIEGSKTFARKLCEKSSIPQPWFESFESAEEAKSFLKEKGAPVVVKADGLAAGKGVIVAETVEEAEKAIDKIMVEKAFGDAGNRVILEQKLVGEEASFIVFTDGKTLKPMVSSQDHKPVFDGDKGPNCYSEDTEILTKGGWKTFNKLEDDDEVAVYNPKTMEMWFEKPTAVYWRKYKGKMVEFKNRNINLLVTPNHKMLVQMRKNSRKLRILEAKDYCGENYIFQSVKWKGKNIPFFVLPEYNYKFNRKLKKLKINFDDWVAFLGIYLSEGYVTKKKSKDHRVYICQTEKSKNFKKIKRILAKIPFKFTYSKKDSKFRINSIQLSSYLEQFGTSKVKHIPDYVKEATPKTIEKFLKAYCLGDGDYHNNQMRISTSSKKMADDLQELFLKTGFASTITVDKRRTMLNPLNKKCYSTRPVYALEARKTNKTSIRKNNISFVNYSGYIGCVTVSTGFVVVRKNNRIAVSGNTGGMGCYSPAPIVTEELEKEIMEKIMQPIVKAMAQENKQYKGVLYGGLMIVEGKPFVIEFNCRFGDPETQVILPRLESDLVPILLACVDGTLQEQEIKWKENACTCVVMASGGYPEKYEKEKEIFGLEKANALPETIVFHAGTKTQNGKVLTNGGRVLGVTALGKNIKESIDNAYKAVEKISFEGAHYRKDIGQKALKRLEND